MLRIDFQVVDGTPKDTCVHSLRCGHEGTTMLAQFLSTAQTRLQMPLSRPWAVITDPTRRGLYRRRKSWSPEAIDPSRTAQLALMPS